MVAGDGTGRAGEDPDGALAALRAGQVATERQRERWLAQRLGDDTTFAGVLVDLAERAAPVAVETTAGLVARGRIAWVGVDHVALEDGDVRWLVAISAVVAVTPAPGGPPARSGREHRVDDTTLAEVLALAAAERPEVALVAVGGARVAGELVAVGVDVAVVRDGGSTRYARLDSVASARWSAADWGSG